MSFDAMTAVFDAVVPLSGLERRVLLVLANYTNADGIAWPNQSTIARRAGSGRQRVQKTLQHLEARGLVTVVTRATQHHAARYRLDVAALSGQTSPHGSSQTSPHGSSENVAPDFQRSPPVPPDEPTGTARGAHRAPDPIEPLEPYKPASPVFANGTKARPVPFKVHARVATRALQELAFEKQPDDRGAVGERYSRLMAQQGFLYDSTTRRKAVDAAFHARDKKAAEFSALMAQRRRQGGPR